MSFDLEDRVSTTRILKFGSQLELPEGSMGTIVGSGPIRSNVNFDDDTLANYRRVDNEDLKKSD